MCIRDLSSDVSYIAYDKRKVLIHLKLYLSSSFKDFLRKLYNFLRKKNRISMQLRNNYFVSRLYGIRSVLTE